MMTCEEIAAIPGVELNPPATDEQIRQAQANVGFDFLEDYIVLLRCSNGLYLPEGNEIRLYAAEELQERNETYQVRTYAPHLFLIGDNGGGAGVFINYSDEQGSIHLIGMGALGVSEGLPLANSLSEWADNSFRYGRPD